MCWLLYFVLFAITFCVDTNAKRLTCIMPLADRQDCGYSGIIEEACSDRGCCWWPVGSAPPCFHRGIGTGCYDAAGNCFYNGDAGCMVNDAYAGLRNQTVNGVACQQWASQTPHKHSDKLTGPENYCRNPNGFGRGPWCYTMDKRKARDHCFKTCPRVYTDDCNVEEDANWPGNTIKGLTNVTTYRDCCGFCKAVANCVLWTWNRYTRACWLKNATGCKIKYNGTFSGRITKEVLTCGLITDIQYCGDRRTCRDRGCCWSPTKYSNFCFYRAVSCHNVGQKNVYYDPSCADGGDGCNAGGQHQQCRFCGFSTFPACPTVERYGNYNVTTNRYYPIASCPTETPPEPYTVPPNSLLTQPTPTLLKEETCILFPPGPGDSSGTIVCSLEEFNEAVVGLGFQKPSCEQYKNSILMTRSIGGIKKKREFAMFLAHVIWESNGLQDKEEQICKETKCPDLYKSPQDCEGQHYYGRGYLRLSWYGNYTAASRALFGDNRLQCNPDLVASDDRLSWSTASWLWKENVHNIPEVRKGQFGASTNAINGNLECRGEFKHVARRRFEIYKHVLKAFHIRERANEKGCYN